jgi:FKBP-type peptidyl-prolyl cis-trans isomerase FklB
MPIGAKWKLFIPSELAYGEAGQPPKIPAQSALLFDIELLGIEEPTNKVEKAQAPK